MYQIVPYSADKESRWDDFVMKDSFNGTFLQTRKFLNYHPINRFKDASFFIEKSGIIAAIFPAVIEQDELISHPGSTFGGPIISKNFYSVSKIQEIVDAICTYTDKFSKFRLKPTSPLFSFLPTELLDFTLEHKGFVKHSELSCFTPLSKDVDPLSKCKNECRRNFKNSEKLNLKFGEIHSEELKTFFSFLEKSKKRYNTKPVHTLEELKDLKRRFPKEILFRGVWDNNQYLSGMMIFYFEQTKTWHFQYLAPNDAMRHTNATTFLFISAMREASQKRISNFSWGISTENNGLTLNNSLYHFKETFGALPCLNYWYEKQKK